MYTFDDYSLPGLALVLWLPVNHWTAILINPPLSYTQLQCICFDKADYFQESDFMYIII